MSPHTIGAIHLPRRIRADMGWSRNIRFWQIMDLDGIHANTCTTICIGIGIGDRMYTRAGNPGVKHAPTHSHSRI